MAILQKDKFYEKSFRKLLNNKVENIKTHVDPVKIDIYNIGLTLLQASKYISYVSANQKEAFHRLILGCMMPFPEDRLNWGEFKAGIEALKRASTSARGGAMGLKKTDDKETLGSRTYSVYKGKYGKKYIRTKGEYMTLGEARKKLLTMLPMKSLRGK